MATRCLIGKVNEDGSVKYIYCHNDGYRSGVGKTLLDFYDNKNIEQLFDLGDLSSLGNNPVSNKDAWKPGYLNLSGEFCVAYKDRNEDCPARTSSSIKEFVLDADEVDYLYLLDNNKWYYCCVDDPFKLLK